jgi:hypothetical protein
MSRQLDFILQKCPDQREAILEVINIILNSGSSIKEFSETRKIKYGKIKSNPFAEIRLPEKLINPILILKLPGTRRSWLYSNPDQKCIWPRMRVDTDDCDWRRVSRICKLKKQAVKIEQFRYSPSQYKKFLFDVGYGGNLEEQNGDLLTVPELVKIACFGQSLRSS